MARNPPVDIQDVGGAPVGAATPLPVRLSDGSAFYAAGAPPSSTPAARAGLSNTVTQLVGAPAVLTSYYIYNPNAAVIYVQVFDVATAGGVTLGTTAPVHTIGVPAGSAANLAGLALAFANGIQFAATTTATGSTAPTTALDTSWSYR